MRKRRRYATLALGVLALTSVLAPAAQAQWNQPEYIDAFEAATRRIQSVRIQPGPLHLKVGDTVLVQVSFLDARGEPILIPLRDGTRVTPYFFLVGAGFMTVPISEAARGAGEVRIVATRRGGNARVMTPGAPFPRQTGQRLSYLEYPVPIEVGDAPTERMTITPVRFEAYAGTTIPLATTVWKVGIPLPDPAPVIVWSSSDPGVATVTDAGSVSFHRAGAVTITAENGGARVTQAFAVRPASVARLTLEADAHDVRTGDVVRLAARAWGPDGAELRGARLNMAVSADRPSTARAGAAAYDDGTFVAEEPGLYTVVAELGGTAATVRIRAVPRQAEMTARVVSQTPRLTSAATEIMVFEGADGRDSAYLGQVGQDGGRMLVYDVTDPETPVLTDSVVSGRYLNDIRVDRLKAPRIGVFTKEGTPDRQNGIVILDLSVPAHPTVISEYSENGGVHDVWIYENRIYLTNNGTGDMHIVDITDPRNPRESGRWSSGTPGRILHDLIVEDGIAYLAYWNDGLIILDVGGAGKGGTLDKPVYVSRYAYGPGGHTHHVARYNNYLFIADEGPQFIPRPATGPSGYIHVVDVSDLENPRPVAKYYPPEVGAHNVWVEDGKLYIAYYQGGLRVVDVSGELRGDLYQQGRQVAWVHTQGDVGRSYRPTGAFAWSPQLYKGHVFVSDMNSGMWAIKLTPKVQVVP